MGKGIDPERVERHLRTLIKGELRFDELTRVIYSTAGCLYKIKPLGVVFPRDTEDVIRLVEYAYDQGISVTARGAGSSLAGQVLNDGLIVDLSKHMNRILEIDPEGGYAVVQPGVVQDRLQEALNEHGKFYPPDPSSSAYSTLGGAIANNASGARSIKYGTTKDYVLELELVLSNGELIRTKPVPVELIPDEFPGRPGTLEEEIYAGLKRIAIENKELIERYRPRTKSSSGYNLFDLIKDGIFDLAKLITGSEGTLAIVTEAKLRIADKPAFRAVGLAHFDDVSKAGEAVPKLLEMNPSAIDVMDGLVIDLVRGRERALDRFLPEGIEMSYLIEFDGQDREEVFERLKKAEEMLLREKLAFRFIPAATEEEAEQLWKVRRVGSAILGRVHGDRRPWRFIEDVTVPPERLAEFLRRLWDLLKGYGLRVGTIGHAGDSNFHVRPLLNLKSEEDLELMKKIAHETYSLVVEMGGSISGEHGDGLVRTPFLKMQFGELYDKFAEVKRLFDPKGILNPGKIVPQEGKGFTDNLKVHPGYRYVETGTRLDDEELHAELERCDGCGACRSYCPVFGAVEEERGASRAKVNLIRAALTGDLPSEALKWDEFKRAVDLCYNCRRCLTECPALVNVPRLCIEARAAHIKERGLSLQNRTLANAAKLSALSSAFAPLSNLAMRLKPIRWMMEKTIGIHRERKMPRYRFVTLSRRYGRREAEGEKRVAYFAGCFANYNDPEGEGSGTVEVLRRLGYEVYLPKTNCCQIARITIGDLEKALEEAEENVGILSDLIERGYRIVFSAPSCLLAVREEYPELLGTPASKEVAENCLYIFELLAELKGRGELNLKFKPVDLNIAYHIPCHLRALGEDRTLEILREIPGLRIAVVTDKCCGMAGTFGMKKQYFELSMKAGRPLFEALENSGAELVATSCGTCRIQIEQATGMKTVHPIEILRSALI